MILHRLKKNYWKEKNLPEYAKSCISEGNFYIAFLLLESSEMTSKLEKYLLAIYAFLNNGNLPPLNSRVG